MNKSKHFSTWFFEPKTTDKTHEAEEHKEEWTIYEAPEEIKVENEKVDSYPKKCLWDNIWFSECHTHPYSSSEEYYIGDIESKASHIWVIKDFCHIDTECVNPTSK